ncbi:hypothetical protein [Streptomyces sp. AHA2]|uniref:hypothetical protein n=1 Tax=Streptomyces sp. AHA2 TaxID=3064526 RepID=UPI002FDFA51C
MLDTTQQSDPAPPQDAAPAFLDERFSPGGEAPAFLDERFSPGSEAPAFLDERFSPGSEAPAFLDERLPSRDGAPASPEERRPPRDEPRGCLFALSQPPLMIFLAVIGTLLLMASLHDLLLL